MSGITDPMEAYFKDGQWGWDGTQWRKLNLLWGYNDRYYEQVFDLTAEVDQSLDTTAVPEGQVYVINSITAFNNTNDFSELQVIVYAGASAGTHLIYELTLTAKQPYVWSGSLVLKKDDYVRAIFGGNTVNDDLYLRVWGYKMKIAE